MAQGCEAGFFLVVSIMSQKHQPYQLCPKNENYVPKMDHKNGNYVHKWIPELQKRKYEIQTRILEVFSSVEGLSTSIHHSFNVGAIFRYL